jgi:hypothetical protein
MGVREEVAGVLPLRIRPLLAWIKPLKTLQIK